ncbi:MAG: AraC family transcriptional regulator [Spirochaetia bacterium]|nr:AraC family transcriptional regulator [Spirochaetia bacterium]
MLPEQTISLITLNVLLQTAESFGINRKFLLEECGMNPEILSSPDNRFTVGEFDRLISKAVDLSCDNYFGLRMGHFFTFNIGNVVTYMVLNCRNYEEVCRKYIEYQKIISEVRKIDLIIENNKAKIEIRLLTESLEQERHMLDQIVSCLVNASKHVVVNSFQFDRIDFTHNNPEYYAEYKKYFNCELAWGMPLTTIWFDAEHLKTPIKQPNPELLSALEAKANQMLTRINKHGIYTKKILSVISNYSFNFQSGIEDVASQIGLSPRNLQMMLKNENTTYQKLLDEVRKEKSLMLLKNDTSITEISYLLGFNDPSSFQRAFKKWMGVPPGEYRKKLEFSSL